MGGGHSMNIKASAVVKCWVVCKNITPQASSVVPEQCWNARCPGRGERNDMGIAIIGALAHTGL